MISNYLIETTEIYRVNTENGVAELIDEAKRSNQYTLVKYTSTKKEIKAKGEVIDSYYKVTLTKVFDDIKDPMGETTITYTNGAF